jgi:hypothetical protein
MPFAVSSVTVAGAVVDTDFGAEEGEVHPARTHITTSASSTGCRAER